MDVFKGYLDTALTGNIWFYAFTGTVVTYFLSNKKDKPYLKLSLLIPISLGIFVIVLSLGGLLRAKSLERKMLPHKLEDEHEPPLKFLIDFLWISMGMVVVVIVILGILLCWPPSLLGPE